MGNNVIENVSRFLATKQITISPSNEWLKACIDWFLSENSEYSVYDVQEFAYNQLLLADLNAVAQACLPRVLKDAHTIKLTGKYFLQVNSFFDVGESAYNQYKKAQKQNIVEDDNEDEELEEQVEKKTWVKSANRMLKMEMTDGVQTVFGMEYSCITKLNPSTMIPGIKVLLRGPVECRNGVIMVQESNIDVLGGEVDSLYEVNHMNKLITTKLNLDENALPLNNDVPQGSISVNNSLPSEQNYHLPTVTQLSNDVTVENSSPPRNFNYDDSYGQELIKEEMFEDSEIFLHLPDDHLIENCNEVSQPRTTVMEVNAPVTASSSSRTIENDIFEIPEEVCEPTGNRVIEVSAKVSGFKSKLLIKDNNWCLTVKLSTDKGSMKACFDSDLLARVIGFNPVEISSQEHEISVNPAIREKMDTMLKKSQQTIKNLNCSMTLAQYEGVELPSIIAISDESAFSDFM